MTLQVQGSDGAVVTLTSRLVKASDLSSTASDLNLDNIPMPVDSGGQPTITNSSGNGYTNFSAFVADFPNLTSLKGPDGAASVPSSISVNQVGSTDNYTFTFTYPDTTAFTTGSFNVQAGVDGTNGTNGTNGTDGNNGRGISTVTLADHPSDTTLKRFTIAFDDSSADQTADFTKPNDGTDGISPSFTAGTITALASNATPTFTITGTSSSPVMNLGIPKGVDGTGAVSTVNSNSPDSNGNVSLSIPVSGTDFDPVGTALQLAIALG